MAAVRTEAARAPEVRRSRGAETDVVRPFDLLTLPPALWLAVGRGDVDLFVFERVR